jgi:hypothetical protein
MRRMSSPLHHWRRRHLDGVGAGEGISCSMHIHSSMFHIALFIIS